MTMLTRTLSFVAVLAMAGTGWAQTAETAQDAAPEAAAEAEAAPNPLELNMGDESNAGEPAIGDVYIEAQFGDWEMRCIKSELPVDPCQMYQLLKDPNGSPVAEINIFPLPDGANDQPAAGATVITPLETLLTQQLSVSVDGSQPKKYPFSWCSTVGCFARLGFSQADVTSLKRGNQANLTIVPVAAPDQKVNLTVSLSGFTAAFDATKARGNTGPTE